jgi:hypothetical protein
MRALVASAQCQELCRGERSLPLIFAVLGYSSLENFILCVL